MSNSSVPLYLAIAALSAALLTAAVTRAPAAPTGEYRAVLVNEATQSKHPWVRHTWADLAACQKALGNVDEILRTLDDGKTGVTEFTGSDPALWESVLTVVMILYQNTGRIPRLSISCVQNADPA